MNLRAVTHSAEETAALAEAVGSLLRAGDFVVLAGELGAGKTVFAKGLVRYSSVALAELAGSRTSDLPDGAPHEVIHRDDLVVLP